MKIFITGGTGLLGGHLLWHLLQKGDNELFALCRKNSNLSLLHYIFCFYTEKEDDYLSRIHWVEGNILDEASLDSALENMDCVYHCAADVIIGNSAADNLTQTNVQGTKNILAAALKNRVRKLCYVSSVAGIGGGDGGEFVNEDSFWDEQKIHTLYAQSKFLAEKEVRLASEKGLETIIVNPGVILGASNKKEGSSLLIDFGRKGMPFYTNGGSGYVDVRDVCRAMIYLMESDIKNERFVLVGENVSNRTMLNYFAAGFGKPKPFINANKWLLYPIATVVEFVCELLRIRTNFDRCSVKIIENRTYYSSDKIKQRLGFTFTSIEQCTKDICSYIQRTES